MSEDQNEMEEESSKDEGAVDPKELEDTGEAAALVETDDEDEVDEFDEMDELEETADEKEAPEKGAYMVIGQGDFSMNMANRGADDPGDNTLCEPQYIHRYGEMLYISDRGNHRILVWEQPPEENGEPASIVLGQEDFADCLENRGITTTLDEMTSGLGDENLDGFTISQGEEDTMSQPAGLCVISGKLYAVDSGNQRTVRWNGLPTEDGEPPNMVLGQDNLDTNEANRRGIVGSGSLFFPMGIHSGDDQHVFIADKDNHRVLIWNKIPFGDGWNADVCLGQGDMDEREPNRGDFDNVQVDSLSFPTGVFYDAERDKLIVVDQGNNRVLIWNKLPNANGIAADVVVGQRDFQSREPNAGQGNKKTNMEGFYFPTDVVSGHAGFFVSDTGNNRVLYWKEIPTENGQPADLVIGQSDFNSGKYNRGQETSAVTLNDPFGLYLEENPDEDYDYEEDVEGEEDGEEKKPEFKLYIADRGNSRVVVWNELPNSPKGEVEEDEEDMYEFEVDDPNLPIGEDEEEDYFLGEGEEEAEDSSEEEVPSV
jgi:hypothetical protein